MLGYSWEFPPNMAVNVQFVIIVYSHLAESEDTSL